MEILCERSGQLGAKLRRLNFTWGLCPASSYHLLVAAFQDGEQDRTHLRLRGLILLGGPECIPTELHSLISLNPIVAQTLETFATLKIANEIGFLIYILPTKVTS